MLDHNQRLQETRQFWDNEARFFDNEPDHGLRNPIVRTAWAQLLGEWLPSSPVSILDIGCGTGSLSLVLAELNHQVIGIDFSEAMIAQAKSKAIEAGQRISFKIMDAFDPQLTENQFEVIVCRHLLWAMPSANIALQHWSKLLVPGGRIILVEGFWNNSVGLRTKQIIVALPATFTPVKIENLSANEALWGAKMNDERCLVVADYLQRIQ